MTGMFGVNMHPPLPALTALPFAKMHTHTPTPPWQHCRISTALGAMRLARSAQGLCGAWFEQEQKHLPAAHCFAPEHECPQEALLQSAAQQMQDYFDGRLQRFDLPLDLSAGTPFQQSVWRALQHIGWGQLSSYAAVASAIGKPSATRAVGHAIGRNPLSIIVPCHRVLGRQGALTGYAGGLARKQALLQGEGHGLF